MARRRQAIEPRRHRDRRIASHAIPSRRARSTKPVRRARCSVRLECHRTRSDAIGPPRIAAGPLVTADASDLNREAVRSGSAFLGPRPPASGKRHQVCQFRPWLHQRPCAMPTRPDAGAEAAESLKRPNVSPEASPSRASMEADWGRRFARTAPGVAAPGPAAPSPAARTRATARRRKAVGRGGGGISVGPYASDAATMRLTARMAPLRPSTTTRIKVPRKSTARTT